MRNLSICMTTRGEEHANRFLKDVSEFASENKIEFIIGADGDGGEAVAKKYSDTVLKVTSLGYLESFINDVFAYCGGKYVFRLDDDELMSPALKEWLGKRFSVDFGESRTYCFPRCNLWGDENHYLPGIYPDKQIRLIRRDCVRWPSGIHEIPEQGYGVTIDKAILHYKFLEKDFDSRLQIAHRYDRIRNGAGTGKDYKVFTIPDDKHSPFAASLSELGEVVYANSKN